jgi:hypothetical protein
MEVKTCVDRRIFATLYVTLAARGRLAKVRVAGSNSVVRSKIACANSGES